MTEQRPKTSIASNWTNGGRRGKVHEVKVDVGMSYPESATKAAVRLRLLEKTGEDANGNEMTRELTVSLSLQDIRIVHEAVEDFLRIAECPEKLRHDGRCAGVAVQEYQKAKECASCRAADTVVRTRWEAFSAHLARTGSSL